MWTKKLQTKPTFAMLPRFFLFVCLLSLLPGDRQVFSCCLLSLPIKIRYQKDGKNKTAKKSVQFFSIGGALEADEALNQGGTTQLFFLKWPTSRHRSAFLYNRFQVFTRLPSFCTIKKASKKRRPLVGASVRCLRCCCRRRRRHR